MKKSGDVMPQQIREVCRAVCAIVHANINENVFFQLSRYKTRISRLRRRNAFADNGVMVEFDRGYVKIKVFVDICIGEYSILENATELQKNIEEEIVLFTSFLPKAIDVIISGINVKKTH
ncbi:hypothetical protein LC048_13885 [Mesobacillus subterraneus]|uniref:hypothetical protein n=1 Tax=Mesobacillus subterraneus TaxID=285983 RepID=UPI001CFF4E94|nr:hypothetical protein [Mesobacillus subterraneus]WLR53613.1 hypothetical protein LC048_13885 [Mesobacillus subterraneus]